VKVEEAVSPPPFLNHKLINVLFSPEANSIGATPEDLEVLFDIVAAENIIQYLPLWQRGKASGDSP